MTGFVENAGQFQVGDIHALVINGYEHDVVHCWRSFRKPDTTCRCQPNVVSAVSLKMFIGVDVTD
jgi:hypothetical protein